MRRSLCILLYGGATSAACGMHPDVFLLLEQQGKRKGAAIQLWFVSLRTSWVSHTIGLPFHFLPAPNSHPKSIDINLNGGGLHPLVEGRGQQLMNLGVGGPKNDEIG